MGERERKRDLLLWSRQREEKKKKKKRRRKVESTSGVDEGKKRIRAK